MSKFIRVSNDPNNLPRRIRCDIFGNGVLAHLEWGSFDVAYYNRTGKDRLNWLEIPSERLGFFPSIEAIKNELPKLNLSR